MQATFRALEGLDLSRDIFADPFAQLATSVNHRIIVGVDYGVSYIHSAKTDNVNLKDVHDIRTYPGPGKEGDAVWKTPSRIAYSSENESCRHNHWGYQVLPKMISYSWTKLLLDRSARLSEFDDPALKRSEGEGMLRVPRGKSPEDVVTDYLKEVYSWIVSYMEKRLSPEVLDLTPMEFWFTVPAIWSDQAKAATLSAARSGGFASRKDDKIFLVPEPEAAGVATLRRFDDSSSTIDVRIGEGILICDCGGGTVDITSYVITQTAPKLEFEELIEGIGGKCGSTFIDREFHNWMSRKFGSNFDRLKFEKIGPGSRFMKEFEMHKRDFGFFEDLDQIYEVSIVIPGACSSEFYDDEESVVKFTGRDMLNFFKPAVTMIQDLLQDQIQRATRVAGHSAISRIVLVGGFGDSPHLNKTIRAWCDVQGITVTCPEHPQAAISRGAALRGFESMEIRRKSRRHYGIPVSLRFRDGIDPESSMWTCRWSGTKYCGKRIEWHIAKGQVIDKNTKVVFERTPDYKEGDSLVHINTLYSYSGDNPPEYYNDAGVDVVATLQYTMKKEHLGRFETEIFDDARYWKAEYTREIFMGTEEGTLGFRTTHNGVELGNSEIKYDFTYST